MISVVNSLLYISDFICLIPLSSLASIIAQLVKKKKKSACNTGDHSSIPGLGQSPGERKGYPFQYSGLENPMDCIVHKVAKSQTEKLSISLFS